MSAVSLTTSKADDDDHQDHQYSYQDFNSSCNISSSSICEIEEEAEFEDEEGSSRNIPSEIKELFGIKGYLQPKPMPSIKEDHDDHSDVYVGVGKSESSMDALVWTLNHAVKYPSSSRSTIVYLIHVFPEIKYIPSPLGKLPKSQVSPEQVETYMAQERGKRRELLQKFLDKCSAAKVKVDTVLIESDMIGAALVDLIPILNITRLVVGTAKSNLRKLMSRKGSGIADEILRSAPKGCEINIICEGKQVMMEQAAIDESLSPPSSNHDYIDTITTTKSMQQQQRNDAFSCMCFKHPKFT